MSGSLVKWPKTLPFHGSDTSSNLVGIIIILQQRPSGLWCGPAKTMYDYVPIVQINPVAFEVSQLDT